MPNYTLSPNMNLLVPTVDVDPGPQYAIDVNASLTLIDGHNHSAGYGVQINPAGINVNADLPFNNNNLTTARSLQLRQQLAVITDLDALYDVNGNLYFNDGSGNQIQLTIGGAIAGTPGSITNLVPPASAVYNSGSQTITFKSNTTTPANLDFGYAVLRNNISNSRGLTLEPPAAMASNYTLILPPLPLQTSVVTLDAAGNMEPSLVTQDLLAQKATGTSVPLGGVAVAVSSGSFTTSSTTPVAVTNQSVTIDTNGRPVSISLLPIVSSGSIDSNTVLLLHCDGTNLSTSFPDSSSYTHTVTSVAGANVDTSQKEFGTGSLNCAPGGHLTTAGSSDWAFGTGDFTIDFWLRLSAHQTGGLASNTISASSDPTCYILRYNLAQEAVEWSNAQDGNILQTGSNLITYGVFTHIAMVRSSGTVYLFINGNLEDIGTDTHNYSNSSNPLTVGYYGFDGLTINGNIDEFRVSKGIARWTSNFVPPTAPYGSAASPGFISCGSASGTSQATFTLQRDGSTINQFFLQSSGTLMAIPPGALNYIDLASSGTHTYTLMAQTAGSTPVATVSSCQLLVYET